MPQADPGCTDRKLRSRYESAAVQRRAVYNPSGELIKRCILRFIRQSVPGRIRERPSGASRRSAVPERICTGFRRKTQRTKNLPHLPQAALRTETHLPEKLPKRSLSPGFFSYYLRPLGGYRCRYCHRRIPDKKLCIDHIYPIYRTKTGNDFWLRLLRIEDVNDVRNLAPACRRCNTKKGRNAGIWVLRAILGRYEAYWVLRKVCFVALVVGLVFLLNFFS